MPENKPFDRDPLTHVQLTPQPPLEFDGRDVALAEKAGRIAAVLEHIGRVLDIMPLAAMPVTKRPRNL